MYCRKYQFTWRDCLQLTPEDKESNNNDDHENGGVQEKDVGDVRPGDTPRLLSGPDDPVVEVWLTADMANI